MRHAAVSRIREDFLRYHYLKYSSHQKAEEEEEYPRGPLGSLNYWNFSTDHRSRELEDGFEASRGQW